ncbi:MAG: M23 family metallopeptidase [Allosphingosinicella sp.]|uniref:M23 family metallopeptidase n=1 Tax=Allosphingosinicella sp. TaxID=2823234 RepID=UPI003921E324
MTNFVPSLNEPRYAKFRSLFKPRDIFLHDGKSLRRISVGAGVQVGAAVVALMLLAWCLFATASIATATTSLDKDVTQMEQQVAQMQASVAEIKKQADERAAEIERRQAFLAALLSGEHDAKTLATLIPQEIEDPQGWAAKAIADSFAGAEGMQLMLLSQAEEAARERYQETARHIRRLGLNPARLQRAAARGQGGPFEAVQPLQSADPRFRQLFMSWRQLDQLEQGTIAIPSLKPVDNANFTSGFGVRSDPFRGRAAMHAGIDLAGPTGTPIYATADGVVGRSEYAGAYGNMVEINHGQGIQTRYAHLSRLIARPGQQVKRGELIGLMGSTGRSTGPHLHYEVRIDGRAVNPLPFMQGNDYLLAVQRRVASGQPVALGGPEAAR